MTHPSAGPLVSVDGLTVTFDMRGGAVRAVDDVTFEIDRGEVVGLVGESGSGKTTLGLSLLRMVPAPGVITSGRIVFDGRDLLAFSRTDIRRLRGREVSLIVQDALAAMNPVTTVEEQVGEVVRDHVGGSRRNIATRVLEMLHNVRLPRPELNMRRHAHELSGGMQQRVVIAGALILNPKLIIADEPTTALDVTVQAQILRLLSDVREETGTSILFITHDLATVAKVCDRVMVMYAGKIVEAGPVADVFGDARHPYTRSLMASLPPLDDTPPEQLVALPGQPPRPEEWPQGCRFHPRCPLREALGRPARCVEEEPAPRNELLHWGACHFVDRRNHVPGGSMPVESRA